MRSYCWSYVRTFLNSCNREFVRCFIIEFNYFAFNCAKQRDDLKYSSLVIKFIRSFFLLCYNAFVSVRFSDCTRVSIYFAFNFFEKYTNLFRAIELLGLLGSTGFNAHIKLHFSRAFDKGVQPTS